MPNNIDKRDVTTVHFTLNTRHTHLEEIQLVKASD